MAVFNTKGEMYIHKHSQAEPTEFFVFVFVGLGTFKSYQEMQNRVTRAQLRMPTAEAPLRALRAGDAIFRLALKDINSQLKRAGQYYCSYS